MPPKKANKSAEKSVSSKKSKSKSKVSREEGEEERPSKLGASREGKEESSKGGNGENTLNKSGKSKKSKQSKKSGSAKEEGGEEGREEGQESRLDASGKNKTKNSKLEVSGSSIGVPKDKPILSDSITSLNNGLKRKEYVPPGEPRPTNCLVVTLTSFEFVKDFHYFVNIQLGVGGEKKRTEVSNLVKNPVFRTNTFTLPLEQKSLEFHQDLHFTVFNVLSEEDYSREHADNDHAGEARLLGECVLGLVPLKGQLIDPNGQGVKQSLKFSRKTKTGEVTVGRFVANIRLFGGAPKKDDSVVVSQMIGDKSMGPEGNPNHSDIVRPLPKSDGYLFHWRLRVDCRSGVDLALNRDTPKGLPSSFVEVGLVEELNKRPSDEKLEVTKTVPDERNPIWNTQLLLVRHHDEDPGKNGFLYVAVRDKGKKDGVSLDSFWLPINKLKPFVPLHFAFSSANFEFENRGKMYFSVVLEELDQNSRIDQFADIVVHKADHDPLPDRVKRFSVAMTLYNYVPKEIEFYPVDLSSVKSLDSTISKMNQLFDQRRLFLSSTFKFPPMQVIEFLNR